jgi:hypothetical protein
MTTLAQRLINGTGVVIEDINLHLYVLDHLAPRKGASVADARKIADKFVFDEDPDLAIEAQIHAKILEPRLVWSTARAISQPMWIEWRPSNASDLTYGFLMDTENPKQTIITFCCGTERRCGIVMKITIPGQPPWPQNPGKLNIFSIDAFVGTNHRDIESIAFHLLRCCICALFVLCTPRVAEAPQAVALRPFRRRQAREYPDKPIIEFRTVKMRIGVAQTRYARAYDPDGLHEVIHRKLHRVIGHYRVYTKDRNDPLVSYVPEHWRGDPELGIVLHNREVTK